MSNKSNPKDNLLSPLTSSIGETLQDAWDLVFGGFSVYVEKKRIIRQKDLMEFKESLMQNIAAIPENRLCEPSLSTIGPALEASKYYFEAPKIREMFSKLIASSMDCNLVDEVHPSFTEIIKQMSPLDAQNLVLFESWLPVAEYRAIDDNGHYTVLLRNAFLANTAMQNITRQSLSISSLERLGLIGTSYDQYLAQDNLYTDFEKIKSYEEIKQQANALNKELEIHHGLAWITPLGKQFRKICLD